MPKPFGVTSKTERPYVHKTVRPFANEINLTFEDVAWNDRNSRSAPRRLQTVQISSIRDLRTWLTHLSIGDWLVIVVFLAGFVGGVYSCTLRHP